MDPEFEIMKRAPVRSVIRCRSVSTEFKALIDTPSFLAAHTNLRHSRQHQLFILNGTYEEYIGYRDAENLEYDESYDFVVPPLLLPIGVIVGSSFRIFGLMDVNQPDMFVLWNPSIRKTLAVRVGEDDCKGCFNTFGVCPTTLNPKIIRIISNKDCVIYTLGLEVWTRINKDINLRDGLDVSWWSSIVTKTFVYWSATGEDVHHVIVSFDVTNEQFQSIDSPREFGHLIFLMNVTGSLGVVTQDTTYEIYILQDNQETFTPFLNIDAENRFLLGFTKNGSPILSVPHEDDYEEELTTYDQNLDHPNGLDIHGEWHLFGVHNYIETLLLYDREYAVPY